MIDRGKRSLLGVDIDAVDYDAAIERIMTAALEERAYSVSALAVHGVMTGVQDPQHRHRLNALDMVTPDGQPVRWGLDAIHQTDLPGKVSGPNLTRRLLVRAARDGIPVFFYGSTEATLEQVKSRLSIDLPRLSIAGTESSKFRRISRDEKRALVERIRGSGAKLTFVGLGCPRQEIFVYEFTRELGMPTFAVGAAFDYLAGNAKQPSELAQRLGLQWLHRLLDDPRRLWRRYLVLNPLYLVMATRQKMGLTASRPAPEPPAHEELFA